MSVHVTLGGAQRELRFTWKAIKRLKKECGVNLLKDGWDAEVADPETMTSLLWAGLIWETPEVTRDQVDEWITLGTVVELSTKIGEAIVSALNGDPVPNP